MLELAKRGKIDLMQDENFAPLMVRMKKREFVHAD
jgi:chromatin segregation and condensation protein Rec8/ScpA/Scc1 (kleisin family)